MKEPIYKLCFQEGILVPKHESRTKDIIKYLLALFIALGIVLSIIFRENIFSEMSGSVWAVVLIGIVYLLSQSGHKNIPSDCELWFYDDRIVHYRPKRYYSRKKSRREYYVFLYKDIEKCQYRTTVKKFDIYGVLEGTFYDYDKNGNLPEEPSYHKTVDALTVFYVMFEPTINFVEEIETHSPIKVEILNC